MGQEKKRSVFGSAKEPNVKNFAVRIHTKEKPFVCEGFDACDAAFSTLYRLTAHKRIHTGH